MKVFAGQAASLAAVIWQRVMHWQLSLSWQSCICVMLWSAVMLPLSVSAEEWQCVIGVVLSVAIDMVMGTELADSSVLTAIRIMASKVAIVARFCLFNTRDIA